MDYNITNNTNNNNLQVRDIGSLRLNADNSNVAALLVPLAKNGATLSGIVQSNVAGGVLNLKTELGLISLKTDLYIKRGAEISLKLEQKTSELIAKIITIDGFSPAKYQENIAQSQPIPRDEIIASSKLIEKQAQLMATNELDINPTNAATTKNASIAPNLSAPQLRGVFLQTPNISPEIMERLQATPQQIKAGLAMQIKIISVLIPDEQISGNFATINNLATASAANNISATQLPNLQNQLIDSKILTTPNNVAIAQTNSPEAATKLTPNILPNPAPSTNPAVPSNLETTLPQPATIATKPTANIPIQQTINPNNQLNITPINLNKTQPTNIFSGIVLQQSDMRELTMQTEIGMVKLFLSTPLPKGSIINFELLQLEQVRGNAAYSSLTNEEAEPEFTAEKLAALKPITELKHFTEVQTPLHLQPHIVPRLGASLGAEMLFLLTALKSGDLKSWIGDSLHNKLSQLDDFEVKMQSLDKEFSSLKQSFSARETESWQNAILPLYDGEKLHNIQFFTKKQKRNIDEKDMQTINHFMLELELSNIGVMQIDGLVQQQKSQNITKFDAIIRTSTPLNEAMKLDISNIFSNAQAITGIKGAIQFQAGKSALIPHPIINNHNEADKFDGSIIV